MKKRILAFLLTAVMAASAFAGCSSKGESAPEGGDTGSSGAAGAGSGAAEEPYDLTFMYIVGGDYPDQAEVEQAMKDLALAEVNVNLNIVTVPSSYENQLMLMLSSNEALDVCPLGVQSNVVSYVANGYLEDLGPLLDKYAKNIKEVYGDEMKIASMATSSTPSR